MDVLAEHERICALMKLQIADSDVFAPPENFVCIIHRNIFHLDGFHLPEHLRGVYYGIFHAKMVAVP